MEESGDTSCAHGSHNKEEHDKEVHVAKRPRRMEPDTLVKVGDQEFHHYSQVLCCASDFFDTALHSGMKESKTMSIELPDKDPEEWKVFSAFLEPCSKAQISENNVEMLIPWFHQFGVHAFEEECDKCYLQMIQQRNSDGSGPTPEYLEFIFRAVSFCQTYELSMTKEWIRAFLVDLIYLKASTIVENDTMFIPEILKLVHDEYFQDSIWSSLKPYLPPQFGCEQAKDALRHHELLPALVKMGMENFINRGLKAKIQALKTENEAAKIKVKLQIQKAKDLPRLLHERLPKSDMKRGSYAEMAELAQERLNRIIASDRFTWEPLP